MARADKTRRGPTKFEVPITVGDVFYLVEEHAEKYPCELCEESGYLRSEQLDEDFDCPACNSSGSVTLGHGASVTARRVVAFTLRVAELSTVPTPKLKPQVFYKLEPGEFKIEQSVLTGKGPWYKTKREADRAANKLRSAQR
jgi:hypothetical protein